MLNVAPLAVNLALLAIGLPVPVKLTLYKVLLPALNSGRQFPSALVCTKVDVPAFNVKFVFDKSHNVMPPIGEVGPAVMVKVDDPKFKTDAVLVDPPYGLVVNNTPADTFTLFVFTVPAFIYNIVELVKLS